PFKSALNSSFEPGFGAALLEKQFERLNISRSHRPAVCPACKRRKNVLRARHVILARLGAANKNAPPARRVARSLGIVGTSDSGARDRQPSPSAAHLRTQNFLIPRLVLSDEGNPYQSGARLEVYVEFPELRWSDVTAPSATLAR